MADEGLKLARRFMETYATGDDKGLLDCLAADWVMHERNGSISSREDLAEITRLHAAAFPDKEVEYLHELVDGDRIAQHLRFTMLHSGRYFDFEPTGRRVEFCEMIFHRLAGDVLAESWRMTYPDSMRAALAG